MEEARLEPDKVDFSIMISQKVIIHRFLQQREKKEIDRIHHFLD